MLRLLIAGMVLASAGSICVMAQQSSLPARTITTAREAHDLPLEEARQHYPVRLKAVVTYYDPFIDKRRPALFVHDATGSVFVAMPGLPDKPIPAGSLVEISGVTAAGDFAPIVDEASVRTIRMAAVPAYAPHMTLSQLLSGSEDGQWVEAEGVVHGVQVHGHNMAMEIATSEGSITASTVLVPGDNYEGLVDSRVRIHANAAPLFNRKMQLTGMHLLFPGLAQIYVVERGVADPFRLPVLAIKNLLRYSQDLAFRHRVHVRGTATLYWPGRMLCIEGKEGLCVETDQMDAVSVGQVVDIVGFPIVGHLTPTLDDSTFRGSSERGASEAPAIVDEQALQGDFDSRLVTMEGKLIGESNGASDRTMVLSSGKSVFQVVLPQSIAARTKAVWEQGSVLRVTGICSVGIDTDADPGAGFPVPIDFRILLNSPGDVVVVEQASWWTPAHMVSVLVIVLAVVLCVLVWVVALRHRVTAQAVLIRDQNETLKNLSFQDGLTGVANRRKFDETLALEFARAIESSSLISLLMLDIDHFKLLNDTYGHQRGDDCLVQLAGALGSAALRSSDLLARYGGEEFAVVMPGCDESGAIAAGERMRIAVRNLSIVHSGSPFGQHVSISVGVATMMPSRRDSAGSLIALADHALYESKLNGRNRTTGATKPLGQFAIQASTA